jgi:hypothetical protein
MCLTEILGRPLADALDEVPAGGKDRRRGRIRA